MDHLAGGAVWLLAALLIAWLGLTSMGCAAEARLGMRPYAIGAAADCTGDGCNVGVEAGGWHFGIGAYLDVGPVESDGAACTH